MLATGDGVPGAGRGSPVTRARAAWSTVPLRTRLTALFAALLLVGLASTGGIALLLLRDSLVEQLDAELAEATPMVLRQAERGFPQPGDRGVPSDYALLVAAPTGEVLARVAATSATVSAPSLPTLTAERARELHGRPFTAPDADGHGRWRVLVQALVDPLTGQVAGSVAVGLPMTRADATLAGMGAAIGLIGVVVVGAGAALGWWGVRRSLRPLRRIEDTAAAIAAGDLTRRVPDAPPSTEVGRLSAALNGMLAQLETAFATRAASEQRMRRFVADASHELRTPLATIRGYGELYRMGAIQGEEELDRTVRRIEDSAVRMGGLVEDLLHLARLDEGRPVRREPVDLTVLAADAVADLRALDPTRDARLVPVTGGTLGAVVVAGDEDRLRQVLANLVGNAVQHTPPGTPVEVAVGLLDGPRAVVEVRDHGPGIDPEHAARVFERFYRVDAARDRQTGGAGLGLSIVAAVVEAHAGEVGILPTPGGGATFRVILPAASDGAAAGDYD